MDEFLRENALAVILVPIGVFFVVLSYAAMIVSNKSGHYVSGVPFFGGLLIFVGFLFSKCKILCLLCLIDYGIWELLYVIIVDKLRSKRFERIVSENGFLESGSDEKKIIVLRNEEGKVIWWNFVLNVMLGNGKPRMAFMVCMNEDGKMFLVLDRMKIGSRTEVLPFDENRIEIDGLGMSAVIEVMERENAEEIIL
ncbi:MAG: hypothetical protein IJ736_06230 [Firmicutes bacterium]|nr:hypothetical protein [Bacillota bacterium]